MAKQWDKRNNLTWDYNYFVIIKDVLLKYSE
jgi:hypothetical protein